MLGRGGEIRHIDVSAVFGKESHDNTVNLSAVTEIPRYHTALSGHLLFGGYKAFVGGVASLIKLLEVVGREVGEPDFGEGFWFLDVEFVEVETEDRDELEVFGLFEFIPEEDDVGSVGVLLLRHEGGVFLPIVNALLPRIFYIVRGGNGLIVSDLNDAHGTVVVIFVDHKAVALLSALIFVGELIVRLC